MCSWPVRGKGKEPVQQAKWLWQAKGSSNQSNFESMHFSAKHLVKQFHHNFMTHEVLPTFFVLSDWLHSLSISNGNLFQLMEEVSWINARVIEENVYADLVKVFNSNMDTSTEKENRVMANVGGVSIEFDNSELNSILGTSDSGLEIFSPRKSLDIDDYVHIDTVKNIYRRIDLSDDDCNIYFYTQCLCLQTQILLRFIQTIVLLRSGHLDEVSHKDIALIDCIFRRRPVNLGYSIIRTIFRRRPVTLFHMVILSPESSNILGYLSMNYRVSLLRALGMKL